jgi:protein O-GlcNAcase / histone acetyltransferase
VEGARGAGCHVIYAIAPGLDIRLGREDPGRAADIRVLTETKLAQLWDIGIRYFAVLFDDLEVDSSGDGAAAKWTEAAEAQAAVCNDVWSWLGRQSSPGERTRLFFCPTQYCAMMAEPDVSTSPYLMSLGRELHQDVDVFWTGPTIVSETIDVDGLRELAAVIKRKPTIWDNLHANDYDLRRIYLGPYRGRDGIAAEIAGVISNPNCEYEANFVPLHTLGSWMQSELSRADYDPDQALAAAVRDWFPRFAPAASGTPHRAIVTEDVHLLCSLFYLPFSHGSSARDMISDFDALLRSADRHEIAREQCDAIIAACDKVSLLFERMTELDRRELCYSLYTYLWEVKEECLLIKDYCSALSSAGGSLPVSGVFRSPFHTPKTYRGGFVADIQRRLTLLSHGTFAHSPGSSSTDSFVIRPATPADAPGMYAVCLQTGNSGADGTSLFEDPEVLGERWVGPYVFLEPTLAFCVEDSAGDICGYVLAAADSAAFYAKCRTDWFPRMAEKHPLNQPRAEGKNDEEVIRGFHDPSEEELYFPAHFAEYPSHLHIDLAARAQGRGLGGRLIRHIENALRRCGSTGVFLEMGPTNTRALQFYTKLGFTELERKDEQDALFLAKKL